ncbi:MAG: hypothetical protein J1E43_12470 [Christensenellaceae bacterium]|nr:hypothetical protein [Christensenellaceae bacterium]
MKSGEDFRRAMGQADDGFVRVIAQVLSDLRVMRKRRGSRRRQAGLSGRHGGAPAVSQDA